MTHGINDRLKFLLNSVRLQLVQRNCHHLTKRRNLPYSNLLVRNVIRFMLHLFSAGMAVEDVYSAKLVYDLSRQQ